MSSIRKSIHALGCVSIAAALAACEPSHGPGSELTNAPAVAQILAEARADPDKALADKVKQALGIDAGTPVYGVEVTAADGAVQLWGTVASSAEKSRFAVIAAGVVGVKAVENRIAVDPGT